MTRRRTLHMVAYLPIVLLSISAIVTMTALGCSGTKGGYGYGYGYGTHATTDDGFDP